MDGQIERKEILLPILTDGWTDWTHRRNRRTNGPDEQMDKNLVEEMILLIPTDEWTEQT